MNMDGCFKKKGYLFGSIYGKWSSPHCFNQWRQWSRERSQFKSFGLQEFELWAVED